MRSCAYCGRELAQNEKCTCRTAESARQAKSQSQESNHSSYSGWQESTYTTGYTKKTKRKFHFKKPHFKKPDFKGTANVVSGFTKRFLHDPVNTVSNPGMLNKWQLILILIITALAVSLCGFFIYSRLLTPFVSFSAAAAGYSVGPLIKFSLLGCGYVFGMEVLFLFTLYVLNRFILKQNTGFFTFIIRPVAAMIPIMVFSLLGALISFFSIWATAMLMLTGVVLNIVLTYEALRAEWSYMPSSRAMYLIAGAYFIFYVIIFNLFRV